MTVAATEIIDETERLKKAKEKREKQQREQDLRAAKWRLAKAQEDFENAQERLLIEQQKLAKGTM